MSEELHPHFRSDPARAEYDLDIGDGHYISWSYYEEEICGGIIRHKKSTQLLEEQRSRSEYPEHVSEFCEGAFTIAGTKWQQGYPKGAAWTLSGTYERPTLSPSFLCHCGDHGFVRDGRWVRA